MSGFPRIDFATNAADGFRAAEIRQQQDAARRRAWAQATHLACQRVLGAPAFVRRGPGPAAGATSADRQTFPIITQP